MKILNTPGVFTERETKYYFRYLKNIKHQVEISSFSAKPFTSKLIDKIPRLTFLDNPLDNPSPSLFSTDEGSAMLAPITLKNGTHLLVNLEKALDKMKQVQDPASQYFYLEKLILSLPINQSHSFDGFYSELNTLEDFIRLEHSIHKAQDLLQYLRKEWLKEVQNPRFNHLILSLLALHGDTHTAIATKKKLPSFLKATESMMSSLIDNHQRDPFEATNHPLIDKRIIILRTRFYNKPAIYHSEFETYLNSMLLTEPSLYDELKGIYQSKYGLNTLRLHKEIRDKDLGALFLISLHLKNEDFLDAKFNSLINKINSHYLYESRLREAINPFFKLQLSAVAGLVLNGKGQTRYLIPVGRFYAREDSAQRSDFYPFHHDTTATIATGTITEYWKTSPPAQSNRPSGVDTISGKSGKFEVNR